MKPLTIGRVAQRAEVGVETIRFYEREGLLKQPTRRNSGYRLYEESTIARLKFIRRAKDLGFTLKEIRELLDLRSDPEATSADIRNRTKLKIADIEKRICSLQAMKHALEKLARQCSGHGPKSECPILEALESAETKESIECPRENQKFSR